MYLENLVFDAVAPQRLGAFWEAAVGGDEASDAGVGSVVIVEVEPGWVGLCSRGV